LEWQIFRVEKGELQRRSEWRELVVKEDEGRVN
jgi:hypothetical protein